MCVEPSGSMHCKIDAPLPSHRIRYGSIASAGKIVSSVVSGFLAMNLAPQVGLEPATLRLTGAILKTH